jgi:hypothetical protein
MVFKMGITVSFVDRNKWEYPHDGSALQIGMYHYGQDDS